MDQDPSPAAEQLGRADEIIVNRQLIDTLYAEGLLSREARLSALHFTYPHDQWSQWSAQLLLLIGSALILSGMIYFFAFNWAELSAMFKLSLVASVMVGCTVGAYFKTLASLTGRVLLLGASVSVGVFMAVFGQIYQTGADAYELFMMWSLLILAWTVLSRFAAQWFLWTVVTYCFLTFWWRQVGYDSIDTSIGLATSQIAFIGVMLVGREYALQCLKCEWLSHKWTRHVLSVVIIATSLRVIAPWIIWGGHLDLFQHVSAVFALIVQLTLLWYYLKVTFDLMPISLSMISMCLLLDLAIWRVLSEGGADIIALTLMTGVATLITFSAATSYLRRLASSPGGEHV